MEWKEILSRQPVYLNLGGGVNCHPAKHYQNYIAVDMSPRRRGLSVFHDLRQPLPLPEASVDHILTEDFLEHIQPDAIQVLLSECNRVLKPGGWMRIGVPDYANPKDHHYLEAGSDPRFSGHVTLTTYPLMKQIVDASPFTNFKFYQYWDGEQFIWQAVDYSKGLIQRTPENYYRHIHGDIRHRLLNLRTRWQERKVPVDPANTAGIRFGHPFYATEIVIDLFKT